MEMKKSNQTYLRIEPRLLMNAIVSKGIDKSRLSSKGWGQSKPIADNRTEDGKAKKQKS